MEEEQRLENYVSSVSIVTIILSSIVLYFVLYNLIITIILGTMLSDILQQFISVQKRMSDYGFTTSQLIFVAIFLSASIIIIFTGFLIGGIGLRKMENWGKQCFLIFGWLIFAGLIIVFLYFIFGLFNSQGQELPGGFSTYTQVFRTYGILKAVFYDIFILVAAYFLFITNRRISNIEFVYETDSAH